MTAVPEITDAMREEARKRPNGYIYCIDPNFAPDGVDGAIPPEGIIGAYPVDADGNVVNEFQNNPNYREEQ